MLPSLPFLMSGSRPDLTRRLLQSGTQDLNLDLYDPNVAGYRIPPVPDF